MSKIVFKTSKTVPGDGMRVTRVKAGVVEMLVQTNPEKWSELVGADAPIVTPPPIEPPPPPPIEPPPVVVVPPVTGGITPATFAAALATAKGGDTLILSAGKYPNLARAKFTGNVTLKSAIPFAASFATLGMNACEGITFDGVALDYVWQASDSPDISPFFLFGCKRIAFKDCRFAGTGDATGHGVGRGLVMDQCSDITVTGGSIAMFLRGILVDVCQNIAIEKMEIKTIATDGIDVVATSGIRIEGNYIHDFKTPAGKDYHSDAIQFWTSGTTRPSKDVIIRGNIIDIGAGSYLQSIFMRNEEVDQNRQPFAAMAYVNVLIENNTIRGAHSHGITVGETIGLTVRANIVGQKPANPADPENADYLRQFPAQSGIMVPTINIARASTTVRIEGNAFTGADWFSGPYVNPAVPPSGWSVSGNAHFNAGQAIPAGVGAA